MSDQIAAVSAGYPYLLYADDATTEYERASIEDPTLWWALGLARRLFTVDGDTRIDAGQTVLSAPIRITQGTGEDLTLIELGDAEIGWDESEDAFTVSHNIEYQGRPFDRTNEVITSTTTVENTTTETAIYTGTSPAEEFDVGRLIELHVSGEVSNDSASDDFTLRVKIGGTTVSTFNPAISNVTNADWHVNMMMCIRSTGATGTTSNHTEAYIDGNTQYDNDETTTVDTTAATDLEVTIQWDNAKATNVIDAYVGYIEVKN